MRFILTVTPGRSGQASLTDLVNRCGKGVLAAFEEPKIRPHLPGLLGDLERRFRRRFVETHEILGRGDVLRAFVANDEAALERHARARLAWIKRFAAGVPIYFDISKYFIRGLHRPLVRLVGKPRIVFLVRDPIFNMRSFVNRGKNFSLDNNRPDDAANILRMPADMAPEGRYLWAWAEGYLRGLRLIAAERLAPAHVIQTADLTDTATMTAHFAALEIPHDRIEPRDALNTNLSQGLGRTEVAMADIETFERWRAMVPPMLWDELDFMRGYDPRAARDVALQASR